MTHEQLGGTGLEIVLRHRLQCLGAIRHRPPIGMPGEHHRHEAALGHRGRPLLGLVEAGEQLSAALVQHVDVEARLDQRTAQKLEPLVAIGGEHPQRSAQPVGRRPEAKRRRGILFTEPEGTGRQGAGAIGQHGRHEACNALAGLRLRRRATLEGERQSNDRRALVFNQPGLDAARAGHFLDIDRKGRRRGKRHQEPRERENTALHGLFPSGGVSVEVTAPPSCQT